MMGSSERVTAVQSVWRFVVFWRYLLLACVVLVGTGRYLFVMAPHSVNAPVTQSSEESAEQSSSLRDKYKSIERGMDESEVLEILGPPQNEVEIDATKVSVWQDRQDAIAVYYFFHKKTGTVSDKRLRAMRPTLDSQGRPLPR
jgi:hypothetical protein